MFTEIPAAFCSLPVRLSTLFTVREWTFFHYPINFKSRSKKYYVWQKSQLPVWPGGKLYVEPCQIPGGSSRKACSAWTLCFIPFRQHELGLTHPERPLLSSHQPLLCDPFASNFHMKLKQNSSGSTHKLKPQGTQKFSKPEKGSGWHTPLWGVVLPKQKPLKGMGMQCLWTRLVTVT